MSECKENKLLDALLGTRAHRDSIPVSARIWLDLASENELGADLKLTRGAAIAYGEAGCGDLAKG